MTKEKPKKKTKNEPKCELVRVGNTNVYTYKEV